MDKKQLERLADLFNQAQLQADRFGKRRDVSKGHIEMKLEKNDLVITSDISQCPCPWPHPTGQDIKIEYEQKIVFEAEYACRYYDVGKLPPEVKIKVYVDGEWGKKLLENRIA